MLGVEDAAERASLLSLGVAEAMPLSTSLPELSLRARRVQDMFAMLPRWRTIGPLTLDLFHRDARNGHRWLGLYPREFGLLWRLSDKPGETVSRRQLLEDVWRTHFDPDTNSVEVHVSRLRSKLKLERCEDLLETVLTVGYRLAHGGFETPLSPNRGDSLDRYLRTISWPGCESPVPAGKDMS